MEKPKQKCSICLFSDIYLHKLTETDENNHSVIMKLQSCVSEIEWDENYMICSSCKNELDLFYEFKEKCITNEEVRRRPVTPAVKVEVEDSLTESEVKTETPMFAEDPLSAPENNTETHTFNCNKCDLTFSTSMQLVSHLVKSHQSEPRTKNSKRGKPVFCHICKGRFSCSSNLVQHLKYHTGERPHVCTYCGKRFFRTSDLNIHEKIHLNKREYKCDHCPKQFNTKKDVRSHKLVVHTDPSLWNFVCSVCTKRFPIKSNYDAHMRRHRNERPFACHLCEKRFIDKSVLQKHFLSHSNRRDHICDICQKEYKDKRIMDIHRRKVHGIGTVKLPAERPKKFLCHLCPNAYYEKNKLARHLCTHTGEKPYFCEICEKRFIDKSYLTQHMKKEHNVGNEDELM